VDGSLGHIACWRKHSHDASIMWHRKVHTSKLQLPKERVPTPALEQMIVLARLQARSQLW
jgi:hypothetical protein